MPIVISSDKGIEEEEKVMEKGEKETAGEETDGNKNEEEVLKEGKPSGNQIEGRDQKQKGSDGEDCNKNEIGEKESSETQQKGLNGGVPVSPVPEIIISSPKEEPEGYLLMQLQKTREGDGNEAERDVQDSKVSKDEDDEQGKGSLEASCEQEHSGIQEEKEDMGIHKTEKDDENNEVSANEETDSAKPSEGNYESQAKLEDDVDTSTEEKSKKKGESFGKGSNLPPIDISQFEGHFPQSDNGPGSPRSEEGESPTYLNYIQDDDVCLESLGAAATRTSGNVTPLDTISEQDESEDEKDEDKTRKTSLPTLFKSKFSSGIDNLSALPGDEGAAQNQSLSEEAENGKKDNTSPNGGDEKAVKSQSSSESETDNDKEDTSTDATPVASPEATPEAAAAKDTSKRRRRKRGKVIPEPQSPIFIREGVRTFSNPVSYFGGPVIKYEDEGEGEEGARRGSRQRNDSIASTTSLD